jgi:uncharacterized Zn-binding protein involved in type VI secretion
MSGVQRVGDPNSGGGIAVGPGHNDVLVNGRPAAIPGTPYTPHIGCSPDDPIHCFGLIAIGGTARTVYANGIPLVIDGAKDMCSHSRIAGSFDVRAQ